mmetsp:Transcript_6175/g.16780  ORF Transcript_6175/g.16780 Transcript_6175/m.16780 type:complete len:205 (+) Transcript_6175:497-1111(+)
MSADLFKTAQAAAAARASAPPAPSLVTAPSCAGASNHSESVAMRGSTSLTPVASVVSASMAPALGRAGGSSPGPQVSTSTCPVSRWPRTTPVSGQLSPERCTTTAAPRRSAPRAATRGRVRALMTRREGEALTRAVRTCTSTVTICRSSRSNQRLCPKNQAWSMRTRSARGRSHAPSSAATSAPIRTRPGGASPLLVLASVSTT